MSVGSRALGVFAGSASAGSACVRVEYMAQTEFKTCERPEAVEIGILSLGREKEIHLPKSAEYRSVASDVRKS